LRRRVGSFFLVMAASGALLYVIKSTGFGDIYTDWTRQVPEALVLALPFYLALLGMVAPAVPISFVLNRERVGPSPLRAATLITAILCVSALVLMTISAYDSKWVMYMSTSALDAPSARPLLPQDVFTFTSTLGPAFMGAWMALCAVQLGIRTVPRVLCGFGIVAGCAVIATMPYSLDHFAFRTLLPIELVLSIAWATAVAVYFRWVPATATVYEGRTSNIGP
jgi:hypothetical protein